jgi:uncharacterized protein YycO
MHTQTLFEQQIQELACVLQEGDVLFTSVPNFLYRAIEKSTASPTSHVGIAIKQNGSWMVAESKVPFSRVSTLANFVGRSDNGWLRVNRLASGLNGKQKAALSLSCLSQMGRLYDFGFNYQSSRTFCSKFVYDAYLVGCGITIGQMESVEAILDKCPVDSIGFWKIWFCGFIPRKNLTVTPHSQYVDSQFMEIYSND